jgi:hypothetical protein
MGESLTQRRRVEDEGREVVNSLIARKGEDKAPANIRASSSGKT